MISEKGFDKSNSEFGPAGSEGSPEQSGPQELYGVGEGMCSE